MRSEAMCEARSRLCADGAEVVRKSFDYDVLYVKDPFDMRTSRRGLCRLRLQLKYGEQQAVRSPRMLLNATRCGEAQKRQRLYHFSAARSSLANSAKCSSLVI